LNKLEKISAFEPSSLSFIAYFSIYISFSANSAKLILGCFLTEYSVSFVSIFASLGRKSRTTYLISFGIREFTF
jgi:hypothetical protein